MDYELQLKVKNAPLLNAMRNKGYSNSAQLSRACGVSQVLIGKFINLKLPAYKTDSITPIKGVIEIAECLMVGISDIFPEHHLYNKLENNTFDVQVTKEDMNYLSSSMSSQDPSEILEFFEEDDENQRVIKEALTEKEYTILCKRVYEKKTFECISSEYGVTKERIRQVGSRAVRKATKAINNKNNFY